MEHYHLRLPKMNELEFFLSLEQHNRQTGRTTALAKACQEIGGIFVVANETIKHGLKEQFPDLQISVLSPKDLIGTNKPVILDHFAWKRILMNYEHESKQQRVEVQDLRRKLLKVKKIVKEIELP